MITLSIDVETFSSVNLIKSGVHKYVASDDFEVMLMAYKLNDDPIKIVDFTAMEALPDRIMHLLTDDSCVKKAWNAAFERLALSKHFGCDLDVRQFECTMSKAAMLGYPLGLDQAAIAVGDNTPRKDNAGKALIRYFTVPCKPATANEERTRNYPSDNLSKWEQFKDYCVQDVLVEVSVSAKISFFTIPERERRIYALDQKINDIGVLANKRIIKNAIIIDQDYTKKLSDEAIAISGIENPNSVKQLKAWIESEIGETIDSMTKEDVPKLLESNPAGSVNRLLKIRQEMAKTSTKKYTSMWNCIGSDNRIRGTFQYYGANRTGRWAGRLVQLHNLVRNNTKDLDIARQQVIAGDVDMLVTLFGSATEILSQLIRTVFIAPENKKLIISDFAAIEARVLAWLADETWRIEVFKTHGKVYEASGAHMFKVPIESITKGSILRDKAKISELALGYQGGADALLRMGALKMGLIEEELSDLVRLWRKSNRNIVNLWSDVNKKALMAIKDRVTTRHKSLSFRVHKNIFYIDLPSGRSLCYLNPKIKINRFGVEGITYQGVDQVSRLWFTMDTYGGKLVENIVQAIARDCLAEAMLRLDNYGYKLVMHVHDEVVIEAHNSDTCDRITEIMGEPISWAPGLILTAESSESLYYKKD